MAVVQLRDIGTDAERAAVMTLRRGPGQERYLGSMARRPRMPWRGCPCPRMWSVHDGDLLVGFVMISDGIPAERLAADHDIVGPYFLWRLLIDERFQGRGYGAATIDAVVAYLQSRPGADVLWTSCKAGPGSPQPFYLRYGFVLTGDVKWGEDLLRLLPGTRCSVASVCPRAQIEASMPVGGSFRACCVVSRARVELAT